MRSFLFVLVTTSAACSTYTSNRSALVPHATPRMTSGQPLPGQGAITAGASSVSHFSSPKIGDDPNAGDEIPGTQLFGALRGQFGNVSVGVLYENGLDAGAKRLKSTQPDVDNGNVQGFGLSLDYSVPTNNPQLRIGIGVEAMSWRVPWAEFSACADRDGCIIDRIESTGTDGVVTFGASVTPSLKVSDAVAVFGNLTVKNHPTIQQKIYETEAGLLDADVQDGPANFLVAAGAELGLAGDSVLATAIVYYDVSRDPVAYGPGAALLLTVPFGKKPGAAPPAQPPASYPPPAPYAPPPAG